MIHRQDPWRSFDTVAFATFRRAKPIGNILLAEAEARYEGRLRPRFKGANSSADIGEKILAHAIGKDAVQTLRETHRSVLYGKARDFGMNHCLSGVTAKESKGLSDRIPVVGIGHSHLIALRYAYQHRAEASQPMPITVTLIQLLDSGYQPNLISESGGKLRFNRSITERLNAASDGARLIFDCISGNEYHSFGLVRHPHPFDFVLPLARDIPLDRTAEIIPFAVIDEMLRSVMGHAVETLRALREATKLPIYHVQSPPPIPSEQHIRTHPDTFREKIEAHGVAAYGLRYKLWLLQSSIYRSECEKLGIAFLPAPDVALDEYGLLRQETWNPDPTHANRLYGELVLDQLAEIAQAMSGRKNA